MSDPLSSETERRRLADLTTAPYMENQSAILEAELVEVPPASGGPPAYVASGKPFPWGCLLGGCLGLLLLMLGGLAAIGVGSVWFYRQQIAKYTSGEARPLPIVEVSQQELQQLEARVEAFQEQVEQGEAADQLVLTADDINALISKEEKLRGKVYVTLEDGLIKAEVSIPASALPGGKDRFFNGSVTVNASLEDGVLIVTLEEAEVNGQPVPEEIMSEIRKQNLAKDMYQDPETAEKLRRFERLIVEGDKLILIPKPASPADSQPDSNPASKSNSTSELTPAAETSSEAEAVAVPQP